MTSNSTPCHHRTNLSYVQCASLRKITKPILASCNHAENATIEEFKSLIGDISSITAKDESDENEVLAASFLDASCASSTNPEQSISSEQPVNKPHVPFSVEEVSLVTTLECWANCNVRVIGKLAPMSNSNYWSLESIGEEGGPFTILVDMKLSKEYPPPETFVQIFGEIRVIDNSRSLILAKFFRDFSLVDVFFYNKAIEEVKKYVPHFIDKRKMQWLRSNIVQDSD